MLLKRGAAAGMTAYDIGSLMARSDFDQPSAMEVLMARVEERERQEEEAAADGNGLLSGPSMFVALLSEAIDELIRPFAAAAAEVVVAQE